MTLAGAARAVTPWVYAMLLDLVFETFRDLLIGFGELFMVAWESRE